MKTTLQPTNHILVKAYTDSEWDECHFAIIYCGENWAERLAKRLDAMQPFADDYNFCSLTFYDTSADFYRINEELNVLSTDKAWDFVQLEDDEEQNFSVPENRLNTYQISLYRDGTIKYSAYGKHTGEEFWTEELPARDILKEMNHDDRKRMFPVV